MFDLLQSYRFWIMIVGGNLAIYMLLLAYNMAFGTIRNKKLKVDAVILTFFAIIAIFAFRIFPREMDIPGILSMRNKEMEGIVCDYKEERKSTVGHADLIGGTIDVKDSETGKVYRFRDVSVPSDLSIGDSVKMLYLKHYKMGVCVEINGKSYKYYIDNNKPVGIIIIVLLLISVPLYYLWVFKIKTFFEFNKDCAIYTYHNIFIKAMKVLYLFMIQLVAVLIIAVLGHYKTSWDWYWGLLLFVNYVGIFCLSFLRQKQFVIMKNKFYYCDFKKRVEGSLSEIERAEKSDTGMIIYTKEDKMEIFCTLERYKDSLLEKLPIGNE
ncbi:MAG: hypothetical protein HDT40_09210 [Lachnospiraceae bacterium]|nr:hypothetical protein [Lachnospiraceae bacterium]